MPETMGELFWMAWNRPRISPEDSGELSAGKLGSRIGVDISKLWFLFRRPCSTPARRHKPRISPHLHHPKGLLKRWRNFRALAS